MEIRGHKGFSAESEQGSVQQLQYDVRFCNKS
ncbi:hypothetical protein LINGRAHAP2_LOCUS2112 [Linum grandiflorum]